MSLRLAKQIIYGVFYLILFSVLTTAVYFLFFKPAPSCFDQVKNQGETGIDCGGPCSTVCTASAKPIELVGSVITFNTGANQVSFLAQIKNPNEDLAARNFTYVFSAYDTDGNRITSTEGNSFIYANEVKYIFVPNSNTRVASIARTDFAVKNSTWDAPANFKGPPLLSAEGIKTTTGINVTVAGRVANNDTVAFPKVKVLAIFGGSSGGILAASQTELENLSPNSSVPFSILYPAPQGIDASSTQVFIYAARP